jgi:predicted enzyme related to lactoylglutathione lyase
MAERDQHMPGLVPERDGYIPGVPCALDTSQPNPEAAVDFYGALFGWKFEDVMPPESEAKYFVARLRGRDVAAVVSIPEGAPQTPIWRTYIWVDSADETASKVRDAGGGVVMEPFDVEPEAGRITAVGTPAEATAAAGSGARTLSAEGSVLQPGLVDTHPHVMHFSLFRQGMIDLADAENHGEIEARFRAKAAETPLDEWVMRRRWGSPITSCAAPGATWPRECCPIGISSTERPRSTPRRFSPGRPSPRT